uniref:Palmitoyltransferase n=1 Tax=Grammatophora oceanica TaxID=210454 RepID=A0A7S1Y3T6_9STRA
MTGMTGEDTPLITHNKASTINEDGPRRRTGAQTTQQQPDEEREPSNFDPGSAPTTDYEKQDRRPLWTRVTSMVQTPFTTSMPFKYDQMMPLEVHYIDTFNDQPWSCSFGTKEDDGIWLNRNDQPGLMMSFLVWLLIVYSGVTVTLLAEHNQLPSLVSITYGTICALALASHAKTMFTDPGSIPQSAVPVYDASVTVSTHAMCSHCQSFKPPTCHHCRICDRCVSRMDHHCPWMNNCVGAGNMKHFILFLGYTWTGSSLALLIFAWNYFLCESEICVFNVVLVQLVRAMSVICVGSLLFTSSMLMNVTYGIITGTGTIDRLKKKATNTLYLSEDEPVPLEVVFGIQGYWSWFLPIDPVFADFDKIMGYSTPQRLLREQMRDSESSVVRESSVGKAAISTPYSDEPRPAETGPPPALYNEI